VSALSDTQGGAAHERLVRTASIADFHGACCGNRCRCCVVQPKNSQTSTSTNAGTPSSQPMKYLPMMSFTPGG
jgi:hypothetical protein